MITPINSRPTRNKSGFTLVECIVVVIIIGAMAALAVPNYFSAVEAVRSREGVSTLTALLGAQKRFALENGGAYTTAVANLDLTIPASNSFNAPSVDATDDADGIAQVQRTGGSYGTYTLRISGAGVITCTGGSGSICTKIGY